MALGEIVLGAFLKVLFDKLASTEFLSYARRVLGIDTQALKKWVSMLLTIQAVLMDAEEKEISDPAVKNWLDELRDLAYDAEDVLDEIATDASAQKLKREPQASTSKVRKLLPGCFKRVSSHVISNVRMDSRIKEITERLQYITAKKNDLGLRENVVAKRFNTRRVALRATTSLVDESRVYGREKEKRAILELLFNGEGSDNELSVIPIVGIGGLGKTTLAQLVYNDDRAKSSFELRAWVYVSEDFDIQSLTRSILQSVTSNRYNGMDLNWLQEKLKEALSGKRFLIVLDDVWNENYERWDFFCNPFRTEVSGCKIIVTSRNTGVASTMGIAQPYHLKGLSDEDCLSLFAYHALGTLNFVAHPNLAEVGMELVKKCSGLPLAAKTLGGLLRTKLNPDEWRSILDSEMWDLPEEKSNILPTLRLSYYHLPSHLKRCFAYCALFPKGYILNKAELVQMWMAEGLVQQSKEDKQMEDVGCEYFSDLISRSFFEPLSSGGAQVVMHDLINDLAKDVAGDAYSHLRNKLVKPRHISFSIGVQDVAERFKPFNQMNCLRTLIALRSPKLKLAVRPHLSSKVLLELLPEVSRLRVLSLSHYKIGELSHSTCFSKHLRYLNLSHTDIRFLPESVSSLINLQTLLLSNCMFLMELPRGIGNLINLRYLDIARTNSLQEMPAGIGNLKSLRELSKFIVGEGNRVGIRELGSFPHLRGNLCILGLHNVADVQDAKLANLKGIQGLDDLHMGWSLKFDDTRNAEVEKQVLESLQPSHTNLKKLSVWNYGGTKFPSWIRNPSFSNVVCLLLHGCKRIESLPSVGRLPSLRDLRIRGLDRVKIVGSEFYGDGDGFPFPSLETLCFEDMPEWILWLSSTDHDVFGRDFQHLRKLEIRNCPKLIGLPKGIMQSDSYISSLEMLSIRSCTSFTFFPADKLSTNLIKLYIEHCENLTFLPNQMQNLTSLQSLRLENCPRLEYLPRTGLPRNLIKLHIEHCSSIQQPMSQWGLHRLVSLSKLTIIGECSQENMVSFPNDDCIVPSTIAVIYISNLQNLESLSEGLLKLTSLKELSLVKCPKLRYLPSEGLPSRLEYLSISDCPLLRQHCRREKGDYWPVIAHIPKLHMH